MFGMKYLVIGKAIDVNPTASPGEVAGMIEYRVIPGLEMLAKWEDEGKVVGGGFAGRRAGAFIVDAASNEEVAKLLATLPHWSILNWEVIPLQSTRDQVNMARQQLQALKATAKP
jgi:muconolactone delta-isomerase